MAKIQKLYKREGKDKKTLVYPATITQAVRDGETGQNLHDYMNDIKPKFKFNATQTDSQLGTVGSIQLSQDGGKTWNPISPEFRNNLRIQGYVDTTSALPSGQVVGTIYGVGPTYAASDSAHTNPIYRLYVYNGSSWVDNGQFTSIAAGVVQETGSSETQIMSQKAVTEISNTLESNQEVNNAIFSNFIAEEEGLTYELLTGQFFYANEKTLKAHENWSCLKIDVSALNGNYIHVRTRVAGEIYAFVFLNEEKMISAHKYYPGGTNRNSDETVIVPKGATIMYVNRYSGASDMDNQGVWKVTRFLQFDNDIQNIFEAIEKTSEKIEIPLAEKKEGHFINNGVDKANSSFHIDIYSIDGIEYDYLYVTGGIGADTQLAIANFYKEDVYLGRDLYYTVSTRLNSYKIVPPVGTTTVKLVSSNLYATKLEYAKKNGFFKSEELNDKIEAIEKNIGASDKLMKVVLKGTEPASGNTVFYIRSKYNSTKDIILEYYINNNTLISPSAAYVGENALSDAAIMVTANRMSNHTDSTAPLFNSSIYWHLFAQHGYPVPRISNTVGMTSADVGAVWKDQLDREYTIGDVTDSIVTLLPTIYKDEDGNDTRGWKTPNSTAITILTHVSGGNYTTAFTVSGASNIQLRPIMKHSNRVFIVDGKEVKEAGTYYCDEFKVSESQVGFDPASIKSWFPLPVLDNANEMARFTWSYNFKGAQCCVNTTIDIRTRVECLSYGATQQQTFFDKGEYKAMFIIPKAAARSGLELDKPFNSPSSNSTNYTFYRTSAHLKDIDDPIDRLIAFLHKPSDNTYLFGMAAGLSLVSGDTVRAKRIVNMPIGNDDHNRVGSLSPSNTNKFYIAAINTAQYKEDKYHFPTSLFKEINYYVSYFDPSENEGQVYWYKDGSRYVIYMHCQTEQNKLAVNLPDFMEGLKVEIVEKTEGATLLTDIIQNGKLHVSYNGDANHIVVIST